VPEYIGPWRVLRAIATGGTAEVYEVQDPESGERLALKLLQAVRTSLRRFDREYEAMTRLNHPSIVRVYHYGLHQGHPWLTMELVRGVPAQSYVKRLGRPGAPRRQTEVLRIGYHVAKALAYIHDRKLVHRDLKSANVLVLPDERVKLIDFGAAHLQDATEGITLDGEFIGTFAYASPEQLRGKVVDHKSDLYSLGVLLYRLATARRPFEAKEPEELAHQHLHEPVPDPRTFTEDLADPFVELLFELLAKDPSGRPASADHVAQRLEAQHGRPFPARTRLAVHDAASTPREVERRRIWSHLHDGPPAALVLLEGEEGSDRLRLLDTLRTDAKEQGWGTALCVLRRGQALTRIVDALMLLAQDCEGDASRAHFDILRSASSPESLVSPQQRAAVRLAAVEVARIRTRTGPAVLFIQEVHRADPLSLELLGGLRRTLQGESVPFKVVATCRSSELEEPSDLARRLGDAFRVRLDPLGLREVAVAVGTMLGRRPPPAELTRRIHEVTAGQPLYVEQAVQDLVGIGGMEAEGSRVAWAEQANELPPPERATAAAARLLERLPVFWRRVLEALAIADDANEPPVLARTAGLTVLELREVLEQLVRRGVLRWQVDEPLRPAWRHPVVRLVVAAELQPARRHVLLRALAEAVRGLPPTRGGAKAAIAVGSTRDAVRAAIDLGKRLLESSMVRSALDMVEPVVERIGDQEKGADVAEMFLLHARCLRAVRPTDPATSRSLQRSRALAEEIGDHRLLARIALAQARLFGVIGHFENFRKYLRLAWHLTPADAPVVGAEVALELSRSYRLHGDLPKAEQWVETALQLAEKDGGISLSAAVIVQAAACRLSRGHVDDAEQSLSRSMLDCERIDHNVGFWRALAGWAAALRVQGRFTEALSQLYRRMPEASQCQDPTPYVELLLATAWIELDLSRLGRAQECVDELLALVQIGEHLHLRLEAQMLNGRILLASGQFRSAGYTLQEVHRGARNADLPVLAEHARALHAETLVALGDREAAAGAFQSAVLGLMGSGDVTMLAEGVRGRARTATLDRDPDEIFKPVARLLDEEPMPLLKLERLLARGTWYRQQGDIERARHALREAAVLLNQVATGLSDTDRAALRVHPWSARIRRGLR
jgi:tetratricopeptide (TPR) repeat protein